MNARPPEQQKSAAPPASGRQGPVHVIDDDDAVRRAIALLLRAADLDVVVHASALAFLDALAAGREMPIGCVLTDVRMPEMDGLALLRRLRQAGCGAPVVVMTAHGDIATAVQAMKAGAADFIEKPFDDEVLLTSIRTASAAGAAPDQDTDGMPDNGHAHAGARLAALSAREREVLDLLVAGKSNKMVAQDLGLSPRTVEVHRARLMARLGVRSFAEAVRLAVQADMAGARGPG